MPRKRRRSSGSGSYYADGDGYRAQLVIGETASGEPIIWRKRYPTRDEARDALKRKLEDLEAGEIVLDDTTTVAEYLTEWLKHVASVKSPNTRGYYTSMVNLHIIPALGKRRLSELSTPQIQAFYAAQGSQYSARTVSGVHRTLHAALQWAVDARLLRYNPSDATHRPSVSPSAGKALSPDQARALIVAVQDDPLEAYWLLALSTGMRPGELRALRWSDVDMVSGLIICQRGYIRVKGQGWVERSTKTGKGRPVAVPEIALASLRRHWIRQQGASELVFANSVGRPLEPQNLLRRHWRPLLERANIPYVRPYDLRHTMASVLLNAGVPLKAVSERLGHSSPTTTLTIYQHVAPNLQREAAERMNDILTGRHAGRNGAD